MARSSGEYQPIRPGRVGIGKTPHSYAARASFSVEDPRDPDQVIVPPLLRRSERRLHVGILPPGQSRRSQLRLRAGGGSLRVTATHLPQRATYSWIEPAPQGRERRESRPAALRRSEQTRFSSASDDEVGGFHARCANAPIRRAAERIGSRYPGAECFGGLMASAQDVRRRIATVITPVANLVAAQGPGGALRQVLEIAIDGYGRLPSAKGAAARHLQRQAGSVDEAINSIIDHHVRLASAQGFVTNIGGVAALPVAIPANITGVAIVQVRMVAAIAHLRGYDLNDHRVRTALVMCLMGGEQVAKHIAEGTLPTSPMAVATAPIFDPELDKLVADEVISDLAARIGGKNIALVTIKRLPLLGGGVSAIMDGIATYQIGRYATGELLRRRALVS